MASVAGPQRRYATPEQQNRILSSGERAPDLPWYSRAARNIGVGIPQSVLQVGELPELVKSLGAATYNSAVNGENFGQAFAESEFGGKEHLDKVARFKQQRVEEYLAGMPENERTPQVRAAADAAVAGSKEYHDLLHSNRWRLSQSSVAKQDQLQDAAGLQPVYQQTVTDELEQILPGLLIPTPTKVFQAAKTAAKVVPYLGAGAVHIAESLLPGVSGKTNAAINAAVQIGTEQGGRYLTDSPSLVTGEGLTTDTGITYFNDKQPATSSNTPAPPQRRMTTPMSEDASAPRPFQAAAAQGGNLQTRSLPFQYTVPAATAAASVASPTPAAAANPDRDPEGGLGGHKVAAAIGTIGTLTLIAAAMRGKVPTGVLSKVVEDVDSPNAAARLDPTPTDHIQLEPSLQAKPGSDWREKARKQGQRFRAGATKTAPLESTVRNAGVVDVETKVNRINRESYAASALEVGNATKRTQLSGEVPLLNRKTVPTAQLRMMRDQLSPAQQELFQRAAVYGDRLESFNVETASLSDKAADARNKAATANSAQRRSQYLNEAAVYDQQVLARADPNRAFDSNVTLGEVRNIISTAAADPQVSAIHNGMRKVVDDFRQAGVNAGMWSQQFVDEARRHRPNYIPLERNKYAGLSTADTIKERAKDKARGRSEPKGGSDQMFDTHRGPLRGNRFSQAVPVADLKDVLDTLETSIHDFHHQLRNNRAKQTWTETMFQSNDWGKTVQRAHEPVSVQDWEKAAEGSRLGRILREENVYSYNANGQMHIMRTADSETARALRNNPSSSFAVADLLRRNLQKTYTGNVLAPGFAPVAAENELGVVRAKLDTKYSKGWLDQMLKRAFPDTAFSKIFDFVPDPTIRLQQVAAILSMSSNRLINVAGEALGNDMMSRSTLIRNLGPGQANGIAQSMLRTVNDVRTRVQFMEHHGILEHPDIVQHNESIFQDWKGAQRMADTVKPVSRIGKAFFDGYVGLVDSVRNSVKYAITSQNLDNLRHKYGSYDAIPNDVMRDFIRDMKHMSGDMTKAIGNETVAKMANAVPYGTNIVNSTLHLMDGMADNKTYTITRVLTNGVAPPALSVLLLSQWMQNSDGTNEFVDYYWNKMPTWQRLSTVPTLSPTFVLGMLQGDTRQPTMNDVVFMRQAPEMIAFSGTVMSGLQAMGWFGVHAKDTQTWSDAVNAVASIGNVNIPFVDAWTKLTDDNNLPTNLSQDSDTVRRMKDALGAIVGGGLKAIGAGYSAGSDALDRGASYTDAIEKAFSYTAEQVKQSFPETPVSPLFGGQRRHYTKTQVRDRNQDTFGKIEDVSKTLSDQKFDRTQELNMGTITDPNAQTIMHELHSTANSGIMKVLRTERANLYKQITRLDANRGNEKLSAKDYTIRSEQLKMQINDKDMQEAEVFQRMEARLTARFGQLGVKDVDSAIAYVQQAQRQ